jgi:hypothetical protein
MPIVRYLGIQTLHEISAQWVRGRLAGAFVDEQRCLPGILLVHSYGSVSMSTIICQQSTTVSKFEFL